MVLKTLLELLIHSQCFAYSGWWSACLQFGEAAGVYEAMNAVDEDINKIHFVHLKESMYKQSESF